MKQPPLNIPNRLADIEASIQELYREKERLENQRDAIGAPALIQTLIDLGAHFVLDHCHLTHVPISCPGDKAEDACQAYIGNKGFADEKPLGPGVILLMEHGSNPKLYMPESPGGSLENVVAAVLASLKSLGIPRHLVSLRDYENEVANHERNRVRAQSDLDKVRKMVEAY